IVRIEGARERAVPTIVGPTADPNRTTDEIITQIVPIKYSSVADLSALLRPLISTRGTLIAHRETNVLIITDAASNITRLLDIIRLVDVQVAQEELQIIPISYADAAELATILTQPFAGGRVRATAPGTPPAPQVGPPPGVPGTPPAAPGQPSGSVERAPLIIPERRSNSLIVHAKKHEVETIKRLVSQLDVNIYGGRRVFIYYAENAKAKELATTLNAIYGARDGAAAAPSATGSPVPGRPGAAPPPAPPPAFVPPGAAAMPGAPDVLSEGQVRFIADEVHNAVIVPTFPRRGTPNENKVNIVSNPHVLTSENKKAIINVSTSVPIVTSQTTGQVAAATTTPTTTTTTSTTTTAGVNQTVEYRDAGVILTVTPRIGEQ